MERENNAGVGPVRRVHTMHTDIASRRLPDLPPEAYGSRMSRFWTSFKKKLSLNSSNRRLRRSQSSDSSASAAINRIHESYRTSLPYNIYYNLIDNHQTMVLPGLRQFPPPIDDDEEEVVMSAPPSASATLHGAAANQAPDYADIEIYRGAAADGGPTEKESSMSNEYQDIDDLAKPRAAPPPPLRVFPGRRQQQGPKMAALASSINTLHHKGWYWGPLNREETENKLRPLPTGSFLIRDSTDVHHLYTLSFKQGELILHTRIEFVNGLFTFFLNDARAKTTGKPSVEELINSSMVNGVSGEFGDSRRVRGRPPNETIRISLSHPVSRFNEVRSLQFLCKFVLRANMNRENVPNLPLPRDVRTWVHEQDYF